MMELLCPYTKEGDSTLAKGVAMIFAMLGRIMLSLGFMITVALYSYQTFAKEITVFDVRKNIPMTNEDPIYKDFYISGGLEDGIKVGMTVDVVRRINIIDAFQKQTDRTLDVKIGELKIIHVQKNISVGRLHRLETTEQGPIVEYDTIMSGDVLDIETLTFEKGKVQVDPEGSKSNSFSGEMVENFYLKLCFGLNS